MNFQLKKGLFVFGLGGLLMLLVLPGKKKAPQQADDRKQQKINAQAALDTIREAILVDKISMEEFEELKRDIQEEYGLRVYFNPKDNRYYVADANGKDILRS